MIYSSMKKIILQFFLLLFITVSLYSGVFDNNKQLNILKSEHFDIIFDNSSISEGYLIYENCESLHQNISNFFDIERNQRINVVITSDIQNFGGYFSIYPSPHIIINNAYPIDNNFNYFSSDFILNVFAHELTHALTMMGENNFFRNTFSQSLAYSLLNFTSFTAEGLAVLSESRNGEGRLNSPIYKAKILQAKIENKFPSYFDVQGNRDIYPYNLDYIYGSFFNKYLLETYGIEAYRSYINELENFQLFFISPNYAFKKVYNKSIFTVYEDFKNSFKSVDVKNINYETLDYNPTKIIKAEDSVYVLETISDRIIDVNTNTTISKFNNSTYYISYNDNKLALSKYTYNPNLKTETVLIEKNKKTYYQLDNFKIAIPFNVYIVGLLNEGIKQYIAYYKNDKIIKKIPLNKDEYVQKVDVLNDKIIYLSHNNSKDTINIILNDKIIKSYIIEEGMNIIDFSLSDNKIILSTISDNQLPRISYIDLEKEELFINTFDTNGGIYSPILLNNEVYYIAQLFDENELRKSNFNSFNFKRGKLEIKYTTIKPYEEKEFNLDQLKKYNKFKYLTKGSLFPFIFPNGEGFSTVLYYLSVDPAEYIYLNLYLSSELYDTFDTEITLNLSSTTGSINQSLTIDGFSSVSELSDNTDVDINYNYSRYYYLNNNNFTKIKFDTNSNLSTLISLDIEAGIGFYTSVGPTELNVFSYYFFLRNKNNLYFENFELSNSNVIGAKINTPYLLPFINSENITINLPFSAKVEFDLDKYQVYYDFSLLLFNIDIQKAFKKYPIFIHNIQSYIKYINNYNKKEISAYLIFPSSLAQTMILNGKLVPGLKYEYNLEENNSSIHFGLFAQY